MKIISFWAKSHDFEIDEIHFSSNPTLLVGESGAGKTQILRALLMLRDLVVEDDKTPCGIEWKIIFDINNVIYEWWVESSPLTPDTIIKDIILNKKIKIEEYLIRDSIKIFERNTNISQFNGMDLPKGLDNTKSFIRQFNDNELVAPIYHSFQKIQHYDMTERRKKIYLNSKKHFEDWKNRTENDLINTDLPIIEKLYIAQGSAKDIHLPITKMKPHFDVFTKIKDDFINIFPTVEYIYIVPSIGSEGFWVEGKEYLIEVSIQLHNGKTISQDAISSGMLRTLFHLAEIYLSPPETVILIDEFENSLGTNCMDVLVDGILHENKNVQYIITSHHPYIINRIPYQNWKIVRRNRNFIVEAKDAIEIIGERASKQEAYFQLMKFQNQDYND